MHADRQRRVPVVGEHPLPVGLAGQLRRLRGRLERERELPRPAARALAARRRAELPQEVAPRAPHVARPGRDERLERAEPDRRAAREVAELRVRLLRDDRLRLLLADRADVAEPDPHRAVLDRAARGAPVHVRRAHLDPAPLRVAHERRRRVEAHRLRVQERAQELGRVVVPQPRRLVGEQRERRRVRLREAEAREADELVVDRVRGPLVDPVAEAAVDEARPERLDRLLAALAAHRAPQPFGLPHAEPRGRHRDRQHLVLEDDDAERLAQRLAQRLVLDRRLERRVVAQALPPLDVRVHGLALDRPGPDERDLHGQVVEVLRAACGAGSASARGSRSGRRRRCPPPGSRRTPPGRRAGRARGRSARRGAARSGRPHPRPPRASRARAGRSSGSRRRSRSPCPTGRSGGRPSPRAGRGRGRSAAGSRSPSRPGAARCGAAGRRSRASARGTRPSAGRRACRGRRSSSSPTRVASQPSVTRASRSSSANGRPSALPTSRIAPRLRYVAKLATSAACSRP